MGVVVILIAGLAAYSNSFSGILVFDDEPAIAHNKDLRLWPLVDALRAPPDTTLSGRPVASLSFAIDHARSGGSVVAYHTTNLVIHLIAALLLFGIVRRTLTSEGLVGRYSESATTLAWIIAAVFVVHPVQTGSVTYVVQRVESLMGLFYLATLYCSIRAVDAIGRARALWMAAAILACALGMGTKEVMVTAPLMVMLWDRQFAPGRATARRSLYLGLAASWSVLAALVAGGYRATSVGLAFPDWPWWRYLMTQAEVVACYLRLAIVPSPLVLDYEWPAATSMAEVAAPGALIVVLLGATVYGLARKLPAAFAGAWFFLILAPTSSVLPIVTEVAAEHRMYLPVAGVITLLVLGLYELRRFRNLGLVASVGVVILFARMTHERNADYHDYDRIWADTVAKRPNNARARNNYATSLLAQGRFAEAEPHLRVAVKRTPAYPEAEANLGVALSALGRLDEGATHLVKATALRPDFADAHRNLGENYALQHRLSEAVAAYSAALVHKPDDVALLNRIAWILATAPDDRVRDGARAKALADRAVALSGRQDAESLDTLGAALAEMGQFEKAADVTREARAVAARRGGAPERSSEMAFRLSLYARGQVFREP